MIKYMFKHKFSMAIKTITVTEDAYDCIKSLKHESESFSDLFKRLAKERAVASRYFGILNGDVNEAQQKVLAVREKVSKDMEKRENVLSRHKRGS